MILWTVQSKLVYNQLIENGKFYCDGRKADHLKDDRDIFRPAYKWMVGQMRKRGIKVKSYPIWAWYRFRTYTKTRKPLLSVLKTYESDLPSCRIEIDVPENLVLLSDFEEWHCVLNKTIVSNNNREISLFIKEPLYNLSDRTIQSWDRIFLVNPRTCKSTYTKRPIPIQACIPYLDKVWIKKVDFYESTNKKR